MEKEIVNETIEILYKKESPEQSFTYYVYPFILDEGVNSITIKLNRNTTKEAQLPVILFDSSKRIRLLKASEGAKGEYEEIHIISNLKGTGGTLDGEMLSGKWYFVIYKRRFDEDIKLNITISENFGIEEKSKYDIFSFQDRVLNKKDGWYSGEIHTHSDQSTGRTSVEEVVRTAEEEGLDFLALTDHFTLSHFKKLSELENKYNVLLFASLEVSSDRGHANLHGVRDYINPLVDDSEFLKEKIGLIESPSMENLADYIHSKGGLFSINHAESGLVGWRHHTFPFEKADIFEAWCLAEGQIANIYPTLWASYLAEGYHLTGIGSSDSHHPKKEGVWHLGRIRNYVKASELSEKAILDGIRKGRVYIAYGSSKLFFEIEWNNKSYEMGDTINYQGGPIKLKIEITDHPSGNIFIYFGKQLEDVLYVPNNSKFEIELKYDEKDLAYLKNKESFIRLEFHEDLEKARFFAMAFRNYQSMRLLSNPIWIKG